jgi:hypothetical protein
MVTNRNSNVTQEIVRACRLQSIEGVPQQINPSIVPTIESNPRLVHTLESTDALCTNSTSTTILTTPTDRDFYLVGATLWRTKSAGSTSTESSVNYTDKNNLTKKFIFTNDLSATAASGTASSISLHQGILVARGTNITLTNSTNNAEIRSCASIFYYIDETSKA